MEKAKIILNILLKGLKRMALYKNGKKIKALYKDGEKIYSSECYEHPASHPADMIEQDENHRFVTDTQIGRWNTEGNTSGSSNLAPIQVGPDKITVEQISDYPGSYALIVDISEYTIPVGTGEVPSMTDINLFLLFVPVNNVAGIIYNTASGRISSMIVDPNFETPASNVYFTLLPVTLVLIESEEEEVFGISIVKYLSSNSIKVEDEIEAMSESLSNPNNIYYTVLY